MNKLLPLVGVAVLVAALTGAAIGWGGLRFPFLGGRASNQLDTAVQDRQSTGTQNLRANQPNSTSQNTSSQPLSANQDATAQTQSADTSGAAAQSDASQTVPALW